MLKLIVRALVFSISEVIFVILMKDIVRDGDPVLRQEAAKVSFPLSEEDQKLADNMMEYLAKVSQDQNRNIGCVTGVNLAAPANRRYKNDGCSSRLSAS